MNQRLADGREKRVGGDQKPVPAEVIKLDVEEEYVPEIFKMLKKHKSMWIRDLGEINVD